METLNPLNELVSELKLAYERGLIQYYTLNRCFINYSSEYVDLQICLKIADFHKEDVLKRYLRDKYGTLIRSISIEPF